MFQAESYAGYKLCWPGDLVINSLWAWGRGLGVSRYHGIVSSAYGVYRLRPPYRKYSHYIHRLVRSEPFNLELRLRSKGIWISRLQLTDESYRVSRVEWLGDVPGHWEVAALHHRYSQCLGKMLDSKRLTGTHSVPYLRNVDVQWDQINTKDLPSMDWTFANSSLHASCR